MENNIYKDKEFCIFILTHGRPNKVITYKTLKKCGCNYPIYIIVDNEDKMIDEYYKNFGKDNVIMFDKLSISKTFDTGDNFDNRKCIIYARNACFGIAKKLGYKYFLELDDDYTDFRFKADNDYNYISKKDIKNIDIILYYILEYYKSINALTISLSQGGDFIGGSKSGISNNIKIKRKAMNSFFCSIDRPFNFIGRINEDVNTYTSLGIRGNLIFQTNQVALQQLQTQTNKGGMTETYLDGGTYLKSFYTVIYSPSCCKVTLMSGRLHHRISWDNTTPMILDEKIKKKL